MKLAELAQALGCPFEGDGDRQIARVASLEDDDVESEIVECVRSVETRCAGPDDHHIVGLLEGLR